jgi:hypothetical protein
MSANEAREKRRLRTDLRQGIFAGEAVIDHPGRFRDFRPAPIRQGREAARRGWASFGPGLRAAGDEQPGRFLFTACPSRRGSTCSRRYLKRRRSWAKAFSHSRSGPSSGLVEL